MAYIAPNSTILICHGVPLSSDYIHTVDFENSTWQSAYFLTKAKFKLEKYSYQRKNGVLTVALTTEQLYDCNYIAYKNTSFENKWFYGFITNIEYVSNDVTNIYFSEDVLQTWMFDYTLNPCFVVREHTLDDSINKNLVPENLDTGEYKYYLSYTYPMELVPVVIASVVYNGSNNVVPFDPKIIPQTSGCLQAIVFNVCSSPQQAGAVISDIQTAGYADSIVSVVEMPSLLFSTIPGAYTGGNTSEINSSFSISYSNMDGYTPKNNKLYHYPYRFISVDNGQGNDVTVMTEYLNNINTMEYTLLCGMEAAPVLTCVIKNYKNIDFNYDDKIKVVNFPVCAYSSDTFKAWYAQNSIIYKQQRESAKDRAGFNTGMGVLNTAISTAKGAVSSGLIGAAAGLAEGGLDIIKTGLENKFDYEQLVKAQMAKTEAAKINSSNATYTSGSFVEFFNHNMACFHANLIGITAEYAKIIDDYFSAFGYQTNTFKAPSTTGRASWNYVKTIGCDAQGSIPQYAIEAINAIFNTGITIWHNPAWVGDYTRDNSIIGNG